MGMTVQQEGWGEHPLPTTHPARSDQATELRGENKGLQSQSHAAEGRGRTAQLGHGEEGYTSLKTDH